MLHFQGLRLRAALFQAIRRFFAGQDFLEVDTPIRQPVLIPESMIQVQRSGAWFLQSSPEQCMKRLLAGGCGNIFQISHCFRAYERGRHHLEEFTLLEWYRINSDYKHLMRDCRELINYVLSALSAEASFRDRLADSCFAGWEHWQEWQCLTVAEAFARYCGISAQEALDRDVFDELLVERIEPNLGVARPTFLYDYPAERASLARRKKDNPQLAERFELYINGLELANGFSELADPMEQRSRFAEELALIAKNHGEKRRMPERFLEDLAGMGDAAGIALGVDRLLMLIASADSIDQVVTFSAADW